MGLCLVYRSAPPALLLAALVVARGMLELVLVQVLVQAWTGMAHPLLPHCWRSRRKSRARVRPWVTASCCSRAAATRGSRLMLCRRPGAARGSRRLMRPCCHMAGRRQRCWVIHQVGGVNLIATLYCNAGCNSGFGGTWEGVTCAKCAWATTGCLPIDGSREA